MALDFSGEGELVAAPDFSKFGTLVESTPKEKPGMLSSAWNALQNLGGAPMVGDDYQAENLNPSTPIVNSVLERTNVKPAPLPTDSFAPVTPEALKAISSAWESGSSADRAGMEALPGWRGQIARSIAGKYERFDDNATPATQAIDARVEARRARLVGQGEDPAFAERAAQESATAGVDPGAEISFEKNQYGLAGPTGTPIDYGGAGQPSADANQALREERRLPELSTEDKVIDTSQGIAANLVAGPAGVVLGQAQSLAKLYGMDEQPVSDVRNDLRKWESSFGGNTIANSVANATSSIGYTMLAGAEGALQNLAVNAGMFAIPAFNDTYKASIDEGKDKGTALMQATLSGAFNLAMPTLASKSGQILGKFLGTEGMNAVGKLVAETASGGAIFSALGAANQLAQEKIDTSRGYQAKDFNKEQPVVDFITGVILHAAPHIVEAGKSTERKVSDQINASVDNTTWDQGAINDQVKNSLKANTGVNPDYTVRGPDDVGPNNPPPPNFYPRPADFALPATQRAEPLDTAITDVPVTKPTIIPEAPTTDTSATIENLLAGIRRPATPSPEQTAEAITSKPDVDSAIKAATDAVNVPLTQSITDTSPADLFARQGTNALQDEIRRIQEARTGAENDSRIDAVQPIPSAVIRPDGVDAAGSVESGLGDAVRPGIDAGRSLVDSVGKPSEPASGVPESALNLQPENLNGVTPEKEITPAAGSEAPEPAAPAFAPTLNPNGTLAILGDRSAILAKLKDIGINRTQPLDGGVMVGKTQAANAMRLFVDLGHIGQGNTPIVDGGDYFASKAEAKKAQQQSPMLRVASVTDAAGNDQIALIPKTDAQIAAQQAAAARLSAPRFGNPDTPLAAHEMIAGQGGLDPAVRNDLGVEGNPRIGNRYLYGREGTGLTLEDATQKLLQDGYLQEGQSQNEALALIKKSLTNPQYTPEGFERVAEAQKAQDFQDHLEAQKDAPAEDPFAPLTEHDFDNSDAQAAGFHEASPELKAEVAALSSISDAKGVDFESILSDVARDNPNATDKEYHELAKAALESATQETAVAGSGGHAGENDRPQVQAQAEGQEGLVAPSQADVLAQQRQLGAEQQRQKDGGDKPLPSKGLTGDIPDMFNPQGDIFADTPIEPADPVAEAKAHLDAAGIQGTERTNTIAQVRRGDLTPDEVAEAHGVAPKEEAKVEPASIKPKAAWYADATERQQETLDSLEKTLVFGNMDLRADTHDDVHDVGRASFDSHEVAPGTRLVPIKDFPLEGYDTPKDKARIEKLAAEIKESREITPLIVGVEPNGETWIIEGQHRARALRLLGYDTVPARVVISMDGTQAEYDADTNAQAKAKQPPQPAGKIEGGVKFSRTEKGTPTLIIQHNLTEENLIHADRMGGIPVPSLAITQAKHPLENFGEITLVGGSNMADPRGYAATKVFGADIYSPRYPTVNYKFTPKNAEVVSKELFKGMEETGSKVDWDEVGKRGVAQLKNEGSVMWSFLKGQGIEPNIVMEKSITPEREQQLRDAGFAPFFPEKPGAYFDYQSVMRDEAFQRLATEYSNKQYKEAGLDDLVKSWDEETPIERMNGARELAYEMRDIGSPQKANPYQTRDALRAQIRGSLDEKFNAYAQNLFNKLDTTEHIFKGYTNAGNRKYIPHTLDNVISILKKDMRGGENFNYGVGSVRSRFTPQFKSITEIQNAKGRLMDEKTFDSVKEDVNTELSTITDSLRSYHPASDRMGFSDTVTSTMYDAAKMGLPRALKENGFEDVPQETKEQVAEFLGKLRNMPTAYFEAKILRAVDLSEFKGAVVPTGTSQKAIGALNRRGVTNIKYYDKNATGDRAAKIQELAKESDLMFSKSENKPLTPTPQIREAITQAYGKLGERLESKGITAIHQTESEALDAAAQARADKNGTTLEQERAGLEGEVQKSTVWHGSPHKFDAFDASKIGTGEGAQAYGHGLYVADQRGTGQTYARNLAGKDDPRDFISEIINSLHAKKDTVDIPTLSREMARYEQTKGLTGNNDLMKLINKAANGYELKSDTYTPDALKALMQTDSMLPKQSNGFLYKVDLPDEHIAKMLDWDRPLSEQAPEVQAAIRPLLDQAYGNGEAFNASGLSKQAIDYLMTRSGDTGGQFMRNLSKFGTATEQGSEAAASELLRKAGIPGIKYLDGGSRGTGEGTSNYVVFPGNEHLLNIEQRNGLDIKRSADGNIQGFHDPQTGKSFLVADHLTPETAPGVFIHEVGTHAAASGALDPVHMRAAEIVATDKSDFVRLVAKRLDAAGESSPEEAAAYMAELYENKRLMAPPSVRQWFKDYVAAIRGWLYKKGIMISASDLTPADIAAIARANARSLARETEAKTSDDGLAFSKATAVNEKAVDDKKDALPELPSRGVLSNLIHQGLTSLSKGVDKVGTKSGVYDAIAPMSTGTQQTRAMAQQWINDSRKADFTWKKIDDAITKSFTPAQRTKMWNAADEENDIRRTGVAAPGKGLSSLSPDERATLDTLHTYSQELWDRAKAVGMVKGEGVDYWTPRMMVLIGENGEYVKPGGGKQGTSGGVGKNFSSSGGGSTKQRMYDTAAETEAAMQAKGGALVRDIRTMPAAMSKLEKGIAGRELINQIKDLGTATGRDLANSTGGKDFFTLDHPAFKTFAPRMTEYSVTPQQIADLGYTIQGRNVVRTLADGTQKELSSYSVAPDGSITQMLPMKDEAGNVVLDAKPIYISNDFKGPLKAILGQGFSDNKLYTGFMLLKSKAMSTIMYSPLIHNQVIFGRALAYGGIKTPGLYFSGNEAKNDVPFMQKMVGAGMVPIGNHNSMLDVGDIANGKAKVGGWMDQNESWIGLGAQKLGNMAKSGLGDKAKAGVDWLGDVVHNKLLWDRVGDLQAGIARDAYDKLIKKGFDENAATTVAAHLANRYAGAIGKESMSEFSHIVANIVLFSKSFNAGNVGTVKDVFYGLPAGLKAQLMEKSNATSAMNALSFAKKKAFVGLVRDLSFAIVLTSLVQDWFKRDKEKGFVDQAGDALTGYQQRAMDAWANAKDNPLAGGSYNPHRLSSTWTNEPGKQDRVDIGADAAGRHQFMRLPTGKVIEDVIGWSTHPLDTFGNKKSPFLNMRDRLNNEKDKWGTPVWDENGTLAAKAFDIAKAVVGTQMPTDQMQTMSDIVTGHGTPLDTRKIFGNITGLTSSQGHPQGPEAAVAAQTEERVSNSKKYVMEMVKHSLKVGDEDRARALLEKAGLSPREINQVVNRVNNPLDHMTRNQQQKFRRHATDDEKAAMEMMR